MAKNQRKVGSPKSEVEAKLPLACVSEPDAVQFMEEQRGWKADADATCPKCGVVGESYRMRAKDGSRNARYLWLCRGCGDQFTVKIGTVMEESRIPVHIWCLAFFRAASSKKGVSALQIQREANLSYKSALFLMHRIRWAMAPANAQESKLGENGETVEFDETYVGGRPRFPRMKAMGRAKDFDKRKTAILGGVERDGRVKARVVKNLRSAEIAAHVREMVGPVRDPEYGRKQGLQHRGPRVRRTPQGEALPRPVQPLSG